MFEQFGVFRDVFFRCVKLASVFIVSSPSVFLIGYIYVLILPICLCLISLRCSLNCLRPPLFVVIKS